MKHQILVIDDLKCIYNTICSVLAPRGCELTYCQDGLSGLKEADNKVYDLVILDIHLPDINGLEVCRQLKELTLYKLRPILLLTSDTRSLEIGLMAGASDYILKPFNELEMIARVFTQLNLSKERLIANSEKESLKKNLNAERSKLLETQNDLHQYFYQTAHKLRSPLSSMVGLLDLLNIEYPEIRKNDYVEMLSETVEKMAYINQQISKIGELKSHNTSSKKFKLALCLQHFLRNHFASNDIEINVDNNLLLYTDINLFVAGLKPIIENAIYYSSLSTKNQKTKKEISLKKIGSDTYLTICDNGPGINDQQLQKIFDIFHIGNEQSIGNGLGLFISKVAFDKLGMDLIIDNELNKFTEVKINIQRAIEMVAQIEIEFKKEI